MASKILLLILAASLFIRVWQLTTIPTGFHRDEALFGYEAYSILKTGRDQHGRFMPLDFEGFGIADYPLAVYMRVPSIAILGLNLFAMRVGMIPFALLTIYLIYKLTERFFKDRALGLIAATVAAFSSWHFFMSRAGYGIFIYALMLLLIGFYFLLFGRDRKQRIIGGVFTGLPLYTYASYYFFLPALLTAIFVLYFNEFKRDKAFRAGYIAAILTTALAFVIFWNHNMRRAPQAAFYVNDAGIRFAWSDKPVGERFALGGSYDLLEQVLHKPQLGYVYKAASNYFDSFSVGFWLKSGRGFESNVSGFGNLLLYEPILIFLGSAYLLWKRSRFGLLLIFWVLAGPLATTFTKDLSSTRLFHMVPALVILEAVGIKALWDLILKIKPRTLTLLVFIVVAAPILFLNVLYFDAYFRHMSAYSGKWWFKGAIEIIDVVDKYPGKKVYMNTKRDMFYVFVLFREKYDPALFQKTAKWETLPENFKTVSSFGRYNFVDKIDADWMCRDYESIYVEKVEEENEPSFVPDGIVHFEGADTYAYFVPTPEKCESGSYLRPGESL